MQIPKGVDYGSFWRAARAKEIKLQSRYRGIYLKLENNKPFWYAQYNTTGLTKYIGRFTFSERGEEQAHKAYEAYLVENKISRIPKRKKSNVTSTKTLKNKKS